MRVPLKEMLDKLGVGYILSAYETCPWSAFDDEKGMSCSAEVRMDSDASELEAEMQIMRDNPTGDEKPIEQVFWLLAKPAVGDKWEVKSVKVKGEDNSDESYNFAEKAANFFHACVQELKMGKIPDIDEIIAKEMKDTERFGGNSQGGGSKSPKIKPAAVMGMKTGR